MKLDPEGRALSGLSTFLTFVGLNVAYLVACLPVVTIGAATSALFEVAMRYSDDEQGRPLADFFPALARDAARGTVVLLVFGVPAAALVFSGVFWMALGSVLGSVAGMLSFLGAVWLFAAFLYGCALVARYAQPLRQTLRSALLLPAAEPARTLLLLALPAGCASLAFVLPPFWIILLTIGFSVGAYAAAFAFRSAFARHD
ncbi:MULTISPECIES: DUF624 domain-containing protein [Microbacterium]|uniref:DUF624 domain-containing protein n=1 Tax=Microbacterium TaxID=33882 RepID=UPI003B9F9B84